MKQHGLDVSPGSGTEGAAFQLRWDALIFDRPSFASRWASQQAALLGEAIQSFSRLYMIPGLYHCPCGQLVDGAPATTVQLMPQLADWVEHGQAPGDIVLPVTAQSIGERLPEMRVTPFDPLKPAPQSSGLNSNYDYIGATSDCQKRNQL
jgi:hypothetical protein